MDEASEMGAINSQGQYEKVLGYIETAKAEGAKLLAGGERPKGPEFKRGFWLRPTLFGDVKPGMCIAQEEIFGPVVTLQAFDTEDEAIAAANNTEYGLVAYFYTRDIDRAMRVSAKLDTGMVGVNRGVISDAAAPFGGIKQSGLGREGSKYGIEEFVEIKYLCMGGI